MLMLCESRLAAPPFHVTGWVHDQGQGASQLALPLALTLRQYGYRGSIYVVAVLPGPATLNH